MDSQASDSVFLPMHCRQVMMGLSDEDSDEERHLKKEKKREKKEKKVRKSQKDIASSLSVATNHSSKP
jgi:hypothetical protein